MPLPLLVRVSVVATATLMLAVGLPSPAPARTLDGDGKPITSGAGATLQVIAHRGGAAQWPQNSLEAFTGSAEAGYDGIETDLVWTRDAQAVLSHDDLLPSRCTSAGKKIHQLTAAQVAKVRCADLSGHKVVPIPTFAQLAQVLDDHPDLSLLLDLKSYKDQSSAGKRTCATRAMALLKQHGLVDRTRILSFYWTSMLPAIRKVSGTIPVFAYDGARLDLDLSRVRLAARLGANAYAPRMNHASAFLARYVKSKGLDVMPWAVTGLEHLAFTIVNGGNPQALITDEPAVLQGALVSGEINLDPVGVPTTTALSKPVTVSATTYKAWARHYPVVLGKALPVAALPMLETVTVDVTVSKGTGTGTLYVGPCSADLGTVSVGLPKGTATLRVKVPLGSDGKLRIYTSRSAKLTVKVVGYTRVRFPDSSDAGARIVGQHAPVILAGA